VKELRAKKGGLSGTLGLGPREVDTSIVNPAHLSPRLADDICKECHQQGDTQVPIGQDGAGLPARPTVVRHHCQADPTHQTGGARRGQPIGRPTAGAGQPGTVDRVEKLRSGIEQVLPGNTWTIDLRHMSFHSSRAEAWRSKGGLSRGMLDLATR